MTSQEKFRLLKKKKAIRTMEANIDRLKYAIARDIRSNEKDKLTACVIRVMMLTSERVGNAESAKQGHFGITTLKPSHITINGSKVTLRYTGKSGMKHEKSFTDATCAKIMKSLKSNRDYLFQTSDGFKIKADRVNRYLSHFGLKSKDIRGYNANRFMKSELGRNYKCFGKIEERKRATEFNKILRRVAEWVGHTPTTLRKHYLMPEI